MNSVERRRDTRYVMRIPVVFRWRSSRSDSARGEGVTRDMSISGAYIVTSRCPPANSMVEIEVVPFARRSMPRGVVKAKMKVLRIEPGDNMENKKCYGFAAAGKTFAVCAGP